MNAAKAKKNPAKVKGAVLIMILAVMTVLIILLAGSIAVVYSAHNRAYLKYTESQGYYTARSILDNFYAELNNNLDVNDSAGNNLGSYFTLTGNDFDTLKEDTNNLSIARAIELDTFKAQVDVTESPGYKNSGYKEWYVKYCDENKGDLGDLINKFEGTSADYISASDGNNLSLYSKVKDYFVNLNKSKLGTTEYSTYSDYYDQFLPVTSVASDMSGDTIVYELSSLDGFGSGTIDTDGDGTADTFVNIGSLADSGVEKAWITVQVQERIFQLENADTYGESFRQAEPHKQDHFYAKVTAHVLYNGEEMTTSLIWKNVGKKTKNIDPSSGVSSLGPLNTTTSFTAIGNATSLTKRYLELSNDSLYAGDIYIEGSFDSGSSTPQVMMDKSNVFFVGDILKINTNPPKSDLMDDGTIFYAKTAQLWGSGASFGKLDSTGTDHHRINLISEKFESHSTTKHFYGRIFTESFDITTDGGEKKVDDVKDLLDAGNSAFTSSNQTIHGDVYCNYLGVPADRVYLELDEVNRTVTLHLNYNPNGTAITDASRKIENIMSPTDSTPFMTYNNTLNVLRGIRIIDGIDKENRTKNDGSSVDVFINSYENYSSTDASTHCDYFIDVADADATGLGTKFTDLNSGSPVQMNGAVTPGDAYKVKIDWSNVDSSIVKHPTSQKIDINKYIDYDAAKSDNVWTLDSNYKKNFKLFKIGSEQIKLVGTDATKYILPTHRSLFGNYFYGSITNGTTSTDFPNTFDNDTGAFSMSPDDGSKPYTFDKFIEEHCVSAEAVKAGVDLTGPIDITSIPAFTLLTNPVAVAAGGDDTVNDVYMPSWARVISASGYIPANGSDGNVYFIDARSGPIDIQLGDGSSSYQTFTGTYVVYGDNQVTVTVPGNASGTTGQTVEIGTGGHCFMFMTEEIFTGEFKDTLVLGDPVTNKPSVANSGDVNEPPAIDWYFSEKIGEAKLHTGGSGMTALCGYITAPSVFFNIDTNINGLQRETYYYGKQVPVGSGNNKYTFFGSVFCKEYKGGQHAGVCYIPKPPENDGFPGNKRAYTSSAEFSWTY